MKTLDEAIKIIAKRFADDAKDEGTTKFPSPVNEAYVLATVYDLETKAIYPRLREEIVRQIERD